jgi:hypothetical protein
MGSLEINDTINRNIFSCAMHNILCHVRVSHKTLMHAYDTKTLHKLDHATKMHVGIVIDDIEDEMGNVDDIVKQNGRCLHPTAYPADENRGHFYIVRIAECIQLKYDMQKTSIYTEQRAYDNDNIFKIGKSCCLFKRIAKYEKNTKLAFAIECPYSLHQFERCMIGYICNNKQFQPHKGREWYKGNCNLVYALEQHKIMFPELYK